MSSRKHIERKSTFNSTTCREVDHHRQAKTPPNRITSMKSLSFDDFPFSQHIFQQTPERNAKAKVFNVFGDEELFQAQKTEIKQSKQSQGKTGSNKGKNPFFQACLENMSRTNPKRMVKLARESFETSQDLQDRNLTTFRLVKRNSLNGYQEQNYDAIL